MHEIVREGLPKDLRQCARVMSETNTYSTGQSVMKDAADEIERLRKALYLISIVEQGCGGTLSPVEQAQSAMRMAKDALDYKKKGDMIARAEQLEAQAAQLRKEAARSLPDCWEVGMRVRYLRDKEWGWDKGWMGTVIEVPNNAKFSHFYTEPDKHKGKFYTTTDDVELVTNSKEDLG